MPIILITGCMKSGKSKFLIKKYYNYLIKNDKILMAFQPSKNTRDGGFIKSRGTNKVVGAIVVDKAKDMLKYDKVDIFFIDELQFFDPEELNETLEELSQKGKTVYIAGLDFDYKGKFFKSYEKIYNQPYITKRVNLEAKCSVPKCECSGVMTMLERLGKAENDIENEINVYKPVCMHHFLNGID